MKRSSGRLKFLSHWAKFNINFDSPKVLSIYQPNNYHVPKINKFPRFIFAFWSHQRSRTQLQWKNSIAHNASTKFCGFYSQNCGRKSFPILVYFYIQISIIFSDFISPFFCATSFKGTYRELRKVESSYKLECQLQTTPSNPFLKVKSIYIDYPRFIFQHFQLTHERLDMCHK